jgi:hypothetical protein
MSGLSGIPLPLAIRFDSLFAIAKEKLRKREQNEAVFFSKAYITKENETQ